MTQLRLPKPSMNTILARSPLLCSKLVTTSSLRKKKHQLVGSRVNSSQFPCEHTEHISINGSRTSLTKKERIKSRISKNGLTIRINARNKKSCKNKDLQDGPYLENLNGENTFKGEKPWWYQLQYIQGILLSGAENNNNAPNGLYSIKIESTSENEGSLSYGVTFEDRDDAKNFCYVLETFFEGFDDVSADIVSLPVQEIKEGVESNELYMTVVPKGKIKLYAGQPLEEVEIAIRSLVDVDLKFSISKE